MSELSRYQIEQIGSQILETLEDVADNFKETPQEREERIKEANRKAGMKFAKTLGLNFNEKIESQIRNILCEKIISEFQIKKITKQDLARCIHASRSTVSRVINRKLKNISIGFMVRLLMALGTKVHITFDSSK